MSGGGRPQKDVSTWVSRRREDTNCQGKFSQVFKGSRQKKGQWSYLIVNLELLHHSQLHEHPQSGCNHGVNVQREIVKGQLVDAQLANQGNVSSLFRHGTMKYIEEEREYGNMSSERGRGWRMERS